MFDLELIKKAKLGENTQQIIGELYKENQKLFYAMSKDFGVDANDLDDFMQNCYFALQKTINVWEEGGSSFLSYLRVNVKFYNFRERLRMKYPVKLHTQNYKNPPSYSTDFDLNVVIDSNNSRKYFDVETQIMCDSFWNTIRSILNEREYIVLYNRYLNNCTLRFLSEKMKLSVETVRRAEKSAINKLKESNEFKNKFKDWWG